MSKRSRNKKVFTQLQLRNTPVTWGIPFDELMFSKFMIYYELKADRMPWDGFISSQGTLVHEARNRIHAEFLKDNRPYLMMLDSDILFPEKLVDRLLAHNLPIVGGWYKNKNISDLHPTIYDFDKEEKGVYVWKHRNVAGTGLEKVDGMGAGCWLMRRDVAEALGEKPYGGPDKGGEDLVLCRRLHELGIPLHVDWSINCAHVGVGIY